MLSVNGPLERVLRGDLDQRSYGGGIIANESTVKSGETQEATQGPCGLWDEPLMYGLDFGSNWFDFPKYLTFL